jgi:hypothetical protein
MTKKVTIASTAILAAVLFLINTALFAQNDPGQKKIRLFIIGNSFSQNASTYLPEITKEANVTLEIGRAEIGGCSLERHWRHAEKAEANPDDKEGKPYKGKSLSMLLSEGKWDVVTLQQASIFSADVNTYRPYAQNLYNYIKSIQPNAKIVLHQTWAYRMDASTFNKADVSPLLKDHQTMWKNSRAAYHTIAKELNTGIFPVGDAFRKVVSNRVHAYKIDKDFDASKPLRPQLPEQENSLHVGYYWNKEQFALDANHANEAGKYLGSLVWYACLFNESPQKVKFVPAKVSPEFAKYLKKVADKVVKEQAKEFNVTNTI